jgi:hypothetical protein
MNDYNEAYCNRGVSKLVENKKENVYSDFKKVFELKHEIGSEALKKSVNYTEFRHKKRFS